VGAFECRGAVFGTVRVLPMNLGLAPCDDVLDREPHLTAGIRAHAWEVGRLVLAPDHRAGPELLRRCLALTLLDMVDHAPVQNIFASCRPALARLYRRFGYTVLVKDIAGPAGAEPYTLIHGDVAAVLHAVCDQAPAHGMMALQ
jgi:predicted GNAT family N-acyltransferase